MFEFSNKQILVGITGGIAAYKSAELVRRLKERGAKVRVVMTKAACEFITPMTMQALSGNPVSEDLLDKEAEAAMGHIELARWADLVIVAPASADFIAKLAQGHANDLLSTLCLATPAKLIIAPAMNQQMWKDEATQANIKLVGQRDVLVLGPAEGSQACGDVGPGRMVEPDDIIYQLQQFFINPLLSGMKVMITAGPTREPIDPVRYISNYSSGKMAYALTEAATEAGASVTLVSGPVSIAPPERVEVINVECTHDMLHEVFERVDDCDCFIAAAAVADYRCADIAKEKIAKNQNIISLDLIRNLDIVSEVANRSRKPFVVGFAAETSNLIENATLKMQSKNMDMIIANLVGVEGSGFNSDDNKVTVLWRKGEKDFDKMRKTLLANELIKLIAEKMKGAEREET